MQFLVNDHASHADLMFAALKKLDKDMYRRGKKGYVRAKMFKSTFDIHRFHGSHNKYMVTDVSGLIGIYGYFVIVTFAPFLRDLLRVF